MPPATPNFAQQYAHAAPRTLDLNAYGAARFTGSPPPVKWLVQDSIPEGVAAVLAAMGEVGKSFKVLELCFQVAFPDKPRSLKCNGSVVPLHAPPVLGGRVVSHGTAVFITAEDTEAAIHRRLTAIDPFERRTQHPSRLRIVALPDAGGPMPFFTLDHNGVVETPEWRMICDQLLQVPDLKLVSFDPLANFALVGLDSDNCHAQHVTSRLSELAAATGATVLTPHHMKKAKEAPATVAEAREAVRGASGIVDGVRVAYALWSADPKYARKVCRDLLIPFTPNRVVQGAIVKANDPVNRDIATYVRTDDGVLRDRTAELAKPNMAVQEDALVNVIAARAAAGRPFTLRGLGGLYEHRESMPSELRTMGRNRLESLCRDLIDAGRVVQCIASGSHHGKWLDVPNGPFALGVGVFTKGAVS